MTLITNLQQLISTSPNSFAGAVVSSFLLIIAAEMGDKSQLVCMTLAAKHKHTPVLLGAIVAFIALNTLAVIFGAAIAHWLPPVVLASIVALLFLVFGIQALLQKDNDEASEIKEISNHHVFFTTLTLIAFAEFGDKTQLAVVAMSSVNSALGVWLGATLALACTSALGVWAGKTIFQKVPLYLLHRISGVFFIVLAVLAGVKAIFLFGKL